jgi:circadian clock protein KaiC
VIAILDLGRDGAFESIDAEQLVTATDRPRLRAGRSSRYTHRARGRVPASRPVASGSRSASPRCREAARNGARRTGVRYRLRVPPAKPARPAAPRSRRSRRGIAKAPTGIAGFDQITGGGLPRGRTSLVCGGAGCGKTLFGMEFLINGAVQHGEPGVFLAFEETEDELASNVASLGFDVAALIEQRMLTVDYVKVERSEIEEAGEYDLEGLFVRLGHAIDSIRARRVVIDSLEALFSGFTNEALLRAELRRLFRWLKDRGVTALITGEQGEGELTRYGLEEYVSDCVISLDHRVVDQVSTRRLRVVKYRGSAHGNNEYPFLIEDHGFSVVPVTGLGLDYPVSSERISTGLPALDQMFEGGGYYRGSSVLVSGAAGTGKSSLAALFADASCRRRERTLYFALEESTAQVVRNMRSIAIDLETWQRKRLLRIVAARPTVFGLEMHLATMHKAVEEFQPRAVIVDPISSLITASHPREVQSMLVRLFDYLKTKQITCLVTSLTTTGGFEQTEVGISSLIDTWLQVRDLEIAAERTRGLYLVKSRGMGHSNQVREFLITSKGIDVLPVTIGASGVLTGSARANVEADLHAQSVVRQQDVERRQRQLERKRRALEAQIEAMRAELVGEEEETRAAAEEITGRELRSAEARVTLSRTRDQPRSSNGRRS